MDNLKYKALFKVISEQIDLPDNAVIADLGCKDATFLVGLALIIAGALGNIIDSAFYGVLFSASTPAHIAEFGGSYAPFTRK